MSIEKVLAELVAAVEGLTSALREGRTSDDGKVKDVSPEKEQPEVGKISADSPPPASEPITFEHLRAPFTAYVKAKGRDAGVALLTKLGVERLSAVKEENFQAALNAIKKAVSETA